MSLDYQFEWMSCSEGGQSILVKGDSIIIQKIILGGCIKTSRAYAFHVEMEGIPSRDFILAFRLADARQDACNPSIELLSSLQVRPGSPRTIKHSSAISESRSSTFQPSRSMEIFKTGFLRFAKTSALAYQVQKLEENLIGESMHDTLDIQIQKGEVAFEARYSMPQCEDNGIGIRASGDTILVLHRGGGGCNASVMRNGLKGRISNLAKGRYNLKIVTANTINGMCEKSVNDRYFRSFNIPE